MPILTRRLSLTPFDSAAVRDQLNGDPKFFKRLGLPPRRDWPPPLYDADAMRWVLRRLEEGDDPRWHVHVVATRGRFLRRARALGVAGFKGPPDSVGEVEIGYSIVANEQRRGVCSEAVDALLRFAFEDPRVALVSAHTLSSDATAASRRVLESANFFGPFLTEENGVVRYERPRESL